MKKDEGSVELGAVILLFFLVTLGMVGVLFATTTMTFNARVSNDIERKITADTLLARIVNDMQPLKEYPFDDPRNPLLEGLRLHYRNYGLDFIDISSGYHLDFLTDEDLGDKNLADYLFHGGNPEHFITWRNTNGLTTNKDLWQSYIKEEAWKSCVAYGWINQNSSENFAKKTVTRILGTSDNDMLFPLVNDFPLMNVNMVEPSILKPLILRSSFKIEKAEEKRENLILRLSGGPLLHSDISASLQVPVTHPIMRYLGTKTTFWKIYFATDPKTRVEAIVAALPQKNGEWQEIAEYRLIDRIFVDD
jgi:hypothetical protein